MSQDSRLMTLAGVGSIMQLIGGMAIPVFAFLLVEGFRNTSDYKKYLIMMAVTALVSEIPYDLSICGKSMGLFQSERNDHDVYLPDYAEMLRSV